MKRASERLFALSWIILGIGAVAYMIAGTWAALFASHGMIHAPAVLAMSTLTVFLSLFGFAGAALLSFVAEEREWVAMRRRPGEVDRRKRVT